MQQDLIQSNRSFSITVVSRIRREEHPEHENGAEHHQSGDSQDGTRKSHNDEHEHGEPIAQQFSNIPPPIPDSSPRTITWSRTTLPTLMATRSSSTAVQPSFLPGATLTVSPDSLASQFPSTVDMPPTSSTPGPNVLQHQVRSPFKLSTPVIAAIAGGSALLLIVVLVLLRVYSRPQRLERPKPSLPILDDDPSFSDEDMYKTTESPLFGGKERFSSNHGNGGGIWSWAQRTRSTELPTIQCYPPPPPTYVTHQTSGESSIFAAKTGLLVARPPPSQSVPTLGTLLSVPSKATAVNSTLSLHRMSMKSVSVYPNSLLEGGDTISIAGNPDGGELAYDGADIASPLFLAQDLTEETVPSTTVRSRVKSTYLSYTPGSYPRMSSVQSGLGTGSTSKARDDDFDLRKLPPIHRTESRKKANKAAILTAALGMASPSTTHIPVSPQPTLYPDDSLSVVDARRSSKRLLHRKPTPKRLLRRSRIAPNDNASPTISSPTLDSGTALGSLMLMEFGATSKSSGTLTEPEAKVYGAGAAGGRSGNAPPRVPSPPALPSLAQMGLEHSNPEAYADYRCPTYSICGLYEDRKSKIG